MEEAPIAAGPLEASVRPRYRLLRSGERIQRGDECLNDDCETWSDVGTIILLCDYNPAVFVPHRRPTPNAQLTCRNGVDCFVPA